MSKFKKGILVMGVIYIVASIGSMFYANRTYKEFFELM